MIFWLSNNPLCKVIILVTRKQETGKHTQKAFRFWFKAVTVLNSSELKTESCPSPGGCCCTQGTAGPGNTREWISAFHPAAFTDLHESFETSLLLSAKWVVMEWAPLTGAGSLPGLGPALNSMTTLDFSSLEQKAKSAGTGGLLGCSCETL